MDEIDEKLQNYYKKTYDVSLYSSILGMFLLGEHIPQEYLEIAKNREFPEWMDIDSKMMITLLYNAPDQKSPILRAMIKELI